jgi:hypothetical protein
MAQAKVLENDMFEQQQPADVFALVSLCQTIVAMKMKIVYAGESCVNYLKRCCDRKLQGGVLCLCREIVVEKVLLPQKIQGRLTRIRSFFFFGSRQWVFVYLHIISNGV